MNVKGLLAPLGERIGALTELVQEMVDNLNRQTEVQEQILAKLELLNESLNEKSDTIPEKGTE